MSGDKTLTEERLHAALKRLLKGKPIHVKAKGKLTLNKINNEAKLGHSYIHKFSDFVLFAEPEISKYNLDRENAMFTELDIEIGATLSEVDSLRAKFNKEKELKKKYKLECDNANAARKEVEAKYAELLYRTYELQEKDLSNRKIVNI